MQLFSYNPRPFIFFAFPTSFCLIKCFICFSEHVLQLSQHVYLLFTMIYCFDVVGLAFLGQDMSTFHVCSQIHVILGSLPCFCLDQHVSVQIHVHMLRSTCLCAPYHAYVLRSTCLCAPYHAYVLGSMLVAMPCATLALLSLIVSLFCFLALLVVCRSRSCSLGLHPYTKAYIKGFGYFMHI